MRLSQNFTLHELTASDTARRRGIDNTAGTYVVDRLTELCHTILEPLRIGIGSALCVSSGYRSKELNKAVGGSATSQHMVGEAVDVYSCDGLQPRDIIKVALLENLPFHQIIDEFGRWVHVSIAPEGEEPRREIKIATRVSGRTKYTTMQRGDYV